MHCLMGFLPEPLPFKEAIPTFQPCQIVCLEYEQHRLYAEVVQTVEGRQTCWVRPLLLNRRVPDSHLPLDDEQGLGSQDNCSPTRSIDLRNGSDLLLPAPLFRVAFDTEVLPLLTFLYALEPPSEPDAHTRAQAQLRQFVRQVWQAHPDLFQA